MNRIGMTPFSKTEHSNPFPGTFAGNRFALFGEGSYRPVGYRREAWAPDTTGS